ncbi:F-box only protein 39 [Planococcus citri]|uniref:F-box only protein 39 n=1 Tax=Planococcus citri TaxID=170843 RepID=UPI0031F95EAF
MDRISSKFKNSYKDEYDALLEALFGEAASQMVQENSRFAPRREILYDDDGKSFFDVQRDVELQPEVSVSEPEEDFEESGWSELPDLLLENIFSQLTMQDRYYASLVCKSWHRVFHLPNVWRIFEFDDKTLTRRLFNYYSGWQYMLDHLKTQQCLTTIGRHLKTLIFKPINNFYNLYEFMNMISFYSEQKNNPNCTVKGIASQITCLQYTFPCNMATRNETKLYGTGGKLLDALKKLMNNLPALRDLQLTDLMLDSHEALQLLDQICFSLSLTMNKLVLINISKTQCPLLHAGVFLNLHELVISPQSLGDDVLCLLAETKLRHLHIVQNSYTPTDVKPISAKAWKLCRKQSPNLRVHLRVESNKDRSILWQECAPVYTITYTSPKIQVQADVIAQIVDYYADTLRVFGHKLLPRFHQPKSFNERIDAHLIFLSKSCPNLHTLVVRERISTATILILITRHVRCLKYFYVRRNAVIIRNDWPKNPAWSEKDYQWIKSTSQSYEKTEEEVSKILGYKWKMLTDKEFKSINVELHN